jgi:hypothetical protein
MCCFSRETDECFETQLKVSLDSVVGITTGWIVGFRFPAWARGISPLHSIQTGSEVDPTSYLMGTGGSFPGVKRLRREADLHPMSRSRIVELYLPSPIRLHGVVLNLAQGQLYVTKSFEEAGEEVHVYVAYGEPVYAFPLQFALTFRGIWTDVDSVLLCRRERSCHISSAPLLFIRSNTMNNAEHSRPSANSVL